MASSGSEQYGGGEKGSKIKSRTPAMSRREARYIAPSPGKAPF
jgi:hypothetical protein